MIILLACDCIAPLLYSGFDIASDSGYEATMAHFDKVVGLKYLKAVHLNDSKGKTYCQTEMFVSPIM